MAFHGLVVHLFPWLIFQGVAHLGCFQVFTIKSPRVRGWKVTLARKTMPEELAVMVQVCNPRAQETEVEESRVLSHFGLHRKTLS
jgi:hypothetical protein